MPSVSLELYNELKAASRKLMLSSQFPEFVKLGATTEQIELIISLFNQELQYRDDNSKKRLIKKAAFPTYKTFEGYSHNHVQLPSTLTWKDLEEANFIQDKRNLVLFGPVGTGKTHMATAIGIKACNKGLRTGFYTVTELVLKLAEARKKGTLEKMVSDLKKLDLLILDEWGYVPIDRDGSQILFRIISDSYEQKSLILTTNIEFSKWGKVFTDDQMAAAMIDRLAHHGHLVIFDGKSYRMEHALMRQTLPSRQTTDASAQNREFPR